MADVFIGENKVDQRKDLVLQKATSQSSQQQKHPFSFLARESAGWSATFYTLVTLVTCQFARESPR